jgi:c-di-GMP-binding flagellar brake protein YcgR
MGKAVSERWKVYLVFKFFALGADDSISRFTGEVTEMVESELSVEEFDGREKRRMVAKEGMVERRQHTRYAVDAWAEVMVKDGTMLFRGRVLDVSAGGCYVETEARLRLAPGTPVEMVFRVNDTVFRCDASSRMVRTRGAGFLFANLDAKLQLELDRLVHELSESEYSPAEAR